MTVGILVFDGVDELDFVGPLDVFSYSNRARGESGIAIVGTTCSVIRGVNGLRILADYDFSDAPLLDVIIVPGGLGTTRLVDDNRVLDWIRSVASTASWVCSVCTGSFVLHAAGLTTECRITTHSKMVEALREAGAQNVAIGERYVVDGNIVTAAGVSAGIDMALWVIGKMHGEEHSRAVQKSLDYYPSPPFQKIDA